MLEAVQRSARKFRVTLTSSLHDSDARPRKKTRRQRDDSEIEPRAFWTQHDGPLDAADDFVKAFRHILEAPHFTLEKIARPSITLEARVSSKRSRLLIAFERLNAGSRGAALSEGKRRLHLILMLYEIDRVRGSDSQTLSSSGTSVSCLQAALSAVSQQLGINARSWKAS